VAKEVFDEKGFLIAVETFCETKFLSINTKL
jgi:hypothetical protein